MSNDNYFVNYPVFLKYKKRFNWKTFSQDSYLKKMRINERIIETPFTIKALTKISDGGKVLDLGCMENVLPLFIASLGYQVTGFDFRQYPYVVPNFRFVKGDILKLPFDANSFDAVTCISTIEHVGIGFYDDPTDQKDSPDIKGMNQIKGVLKKDGLLVLTVPFGKSHVNEQQRIYDSDGLNRLLLGFDIVEKKFYKDVESAATNNYWQEIDVKEANSLSSINDTDCVACVIGKNNK